MATANQPHDQPRANKTDAGNGSKAICRVSKVLRSPSPDPKRSLQKMESRISIHEPFPEPSLGRRFDELTERERRFFVGDEYLPLSPNHCERIKLLSSTDAQRIWEWLPLKNRVLWPSPKSAFTHEDSLLLKWDTDEDPEVRDWLWSRGIPFRREVFILHADRRTVIQTEWKMLVRYWDAFAWSVGVEALVIDRSLSWCCHLHHESVLIFETFNKANKALHPTAGNAPV